MDHGQSGELWWRLACKYGWSRDPAVALCHRDHLIARIENAGIKDDLALLNTLIDPQIVSSAA